MVINPKNHQKLFFWCINEAIELVFKAVITGRDILKYSDLNAYFRDNLVGYKVSQKQISRMAYELKRRKYIEVGNNGSIKLTNKARLKIIDKVIDAKRDDGRFRLVSFDIPEVKRSNRNNFRRAIKRMGFLQIQKSLWVTDRNIGDFIEMSAKEYGVEDCIAYFVVEKSNIDEYMKKILNRK